MENTLTANQEQKLGAGTIVTFGGSFIIDDAEREAEERKSLANRSRLVNKGLKIRLKKYRPQKRWRRK